MKTGDFKSGVFVRADSKELTVAFFVRADSKGLTGESRKSAVESRKQEGGRAVRA